MIAGPVDNEVLEKIEKETDSTLQMYVGMLSEVAAAIEKLTEAAKKSKDRKKTT